MVFKVIVKNVPVSAALRIASVNTAYIQAEVSLVFCPATE